MFLYFTNVVYGWSPLQIIHKWSQLEFDFPNVIAREEAIKNGDFKPKSIIPIDVDVYKDKVFVTIPRFQSGVPITLGKVTNNNYRNNPIITAYPSKRWQMNYSDCNPDRIVSVFRMQV